MNWLLLFDVDGTLIDSCQIGLDQLLDIAQGKGLPISQDVLSKIQASWNYGGLTVIRSAWPDANAEEIYKQWAEINMQRPIPMVNGATETLKALRVYFTLGVLTNRDIDSTLFHISTISHLFDFVSSVHTTFKKPDPRSMSEVLEKCKNLEVSPGHIIYIGDTADVDWETARSVNMHFYGVLTGVGTRKEFLEAGVKPKYIIDSIADLPRVLNLDEIAKSKSPR